MGPSIVFSKMGDASINWLATLILASGGILIFYLFIKSLMTVSATLLGTFETLMTDDSFCKHVFKRWKA